MSKMSNLAFGLKELSAKSGYSVDFLTDVYFELLEGDGEVDWRYFEAVAMEHDY